MAALVAAGLTAAFTGYAGAQQTKAITGIDKIHQQARVGNKVCFTEHAHYGEGTMPSRKGAEGAAIRAWQVFTADEYGTAWGKYSLAIAKTMSCSQSGAAWTCKTNARPCRPGK